MKKTLAILLVLATLMSLVAVASAAAKIEQFDVVKFTGNAYGYEKAGSKKTNVILRKGSCAFVNAVSSNGKWARIVVDWYGDLDDNYEQLWFSTDTMRLLKETDTFVPLVFASGGSGKSYQIEKARTFAPAGLTRVKAVGKVNVRKTASLYGKSLGVLRKGQSLKYLKKVSMDSRGVVFFKVRYNGKDAWVSSYYTKLGKYTKLDGDWFYKRYYGF